MGGGIAKPIKGLSETSIGSLAVRLTAAPEYDGAPSDDQSVMIESYLHPGFYMHARHYGWNIGADEGDPGAGGYWILESRADLELQEYEGARCTWDCGSYGSGSMGYD